MGMRWAKIDQEPVCSLLVSRQRKMEHNWPKTILELILVLVLMVACCCLAELLHFHSTKIMAGNVMAKESGYRLTVYTGSETFTCRAQLHSWVIVQVGDQVGVVLLVGNWTGIRYVCRVSLAGE